MTEISPGAAASMAALPITTDEASELSGAVVIAVDMGGTKIAGALVDRQGHLTDRYTAPTWPETGTQGFDALVSVINTLQAVCMRRGVPIHAVSVSVAGVVRHETGVIQLAPNLHWYDFPLRAALVERLRLPVLLGNDGKLATLGEYRAGAGAGSDVLMGVWIGTGVGGGIVINGQLLHGAHEAAGEFAYMLPERGSLARQYPDLGALEMRIAGPAITRCAEEILATAPTVPSRLRAGTTAVRASDVFAAAHAGDAIARAVVGEVLDYIALAFANIAVVLDPHRIVFGGSVGLALAPWYPAIRARLSGRIPHVPPIMAAALGNDAPLVGAAVLAWAKS